MATNPLIALSGRVPDIRPALRDFSNDQQRKVDNVRADRRADTDEERLKLQAQRVKQQLESEGRIDSAKTSIEFNMRALAALRRGDVQTVQRLGEGRVRALREKGIPSNDTEAFLQLVEQDPQAAIVDAETEIQIGERMGLVERAPNDAPFTGIAKARKDLERGLITEQEFDSLTAQEDKADFINVPGVGLVRVKGDSADVAIAARRKSSSSGPRGAAAKAIFDQQLIDTQFGAESPQAQAHREMLDASSKGEAPKLTDVSGLRKEFTKQSGDFVQVRDAFGKVQAATSNPSAAGDLALIFNFMKMLDPGSVVREGEFATAQNAASVPDRVRSSYNRVISGERLIPEQRQDFLDQSKNIFASQTRFQKNLEGSFTDIASRQNMDPENVVVDFMGEFRDMKEAPSDDEVIPGISDPAQMTDEEIEKALGQSG